MKIIPIFLISLLVVSCTEKPEDPDYGEFREITSILSVKEFEEIKTFILSNGDQLTFCNMYNDNPHYDFGDFDAYLNPETGQQNINCDPALSDFNMLVIQDFSDSLTYYYMLLLRKGDLNKTDVVGALPGMRERNVYLRNFYYHELGYMEERIQAYLAAIREGMGE